VKYAFVEPILTAPVIFWTYCWLYILPKL